MQCIRFAALDGDNLTVHILLPILIFHYSSVPIHNYVLIPYISIRNYMHQIMFTMFATGIPSIAMVLRTGDNHHNHMIMNERKERRQLLHMLAYRI